MNSLQKILVVGATGALGRPVVKLLCERGIAVRAINRHPEQAADLAALGAEVVAGDLTDAASLQRACQGVTRVLAAAHGLLGRGRYRSEEVDDIGHRRLISLARAAGVQRFVYTSGMGVSADHPIDFFRTKYQIEQVLATSGLDTVILKPTAFMEHHVHQFNGQVVLTKGKARLIGQGTKPRNFIRAADLARFAVRALLEDPPPFRALDIGGHDHASNAEVAAMYARAAGITPAASHLSPLIPRTLAPVVSLFHPGVARLMRLMSLPDEAFDEHFHGAAALEQTYGIRLTRLQDFIHQRVRDAGT
jgi:NADH dehydrogenase